MFLGIDIGGTKTLVALFSKRGRIIRKQKFKTARESERFLSDLINTLKEFQKYKISSIVVAIPGLVQKNYSVSFGNRDWDEIDIFTPIKNLFDCSIYFENDANLAALFESHRLVGKTIFLTFSTGIGGGIVEDGQILPESRTFEPGHEKYTYKGEMAEWEDIAAASALEKAYQVDCATDLRGSEIMRDIADRVALGLPKIIDQYKPDNIILGGPMGKIFKLYRRYLPNLGVKYRRPRRPNESVIYGCFLYAKKRGGIGQ